MNVQLRAIVSPLLTLPLLAIELRGLSLIPYLFREVHETPLSLDSSISLLCIDT
jgi:hypothetical protein